MMIWNYLCSVDVIVVLRCALIIIYWTNHLLISLIGAYRCQSWTQGQARRRTSLKRTTHCELYTDHTTNMQIKIDVIHYLNALLCENKVIIEWWFESSIKCMCSVDNFSILMCTFFWTKHMSISLIFFFKYYLSHYTTKMIIKIDII